MPAPAIQTPTAPGYHSPRPSTPPRPAPRYAVVDDAWTVFGVVLIAGLVLGAAYCVWRACCPTVETLPTVVVEATALPAPASLPYPQSHGQFVPAGTPVPARARSLPVADQPIAWGDLTLMLRAGLGDADIIDALRGKQLVVTIGPAQAAMLRELGAGDRLVNYLRSRALYWSPVTAPGVASVVLAPPRPAAAPARVVIQTAQTPPTPTPVDYAAKDRQIRSLQSQIDAIDAQILRIRSHPERSWPGGDYNGPGYLTGEESQLKTTLDQLDKQRNDLRREKWKLEGR